MSDLVDSLLTLARADEGRFDLYREPVELEPLVREVYETAVILGEDAGLTLSLPTLENGVVMGDRTRLRQLLLNLVTNAIKYTPRGGRVELAVTRRPSDEIAITVRDTGIGISAADLPHVFDRFWRADRARSRASERGGFGLGLAIAQWIVQAHGGTITVQSRLGRGSMFTVAAARRAGRRRAPATPSRAVETLVDGCAESSVAIARMLTSASPTLNLRRHSARYGRAIAYPTEQFARVYFLYPIRPTRHVRQPHRVASARAEARGRDALELRHPRRADHRPRSYATLHATATRSRSRRRRRSSSSQVKKDEPPPPKEKPKPPPPDVVMKAPPPKGFQVLTAPIKIPTCSPTSTSPRRSRTRRTSREGRRRRYRQGRRRRHAAADQRQPDLLRVPGREAGRAVPGQPGAALSRHAALGERRGRSARAVRRRHDGPRRHEHVQGAQVDARPVHERRQERRCRT